MARMRKTTIHLTGDTVATMSRDGRPRAYEVQADGTLRELLDADLALAFADQRAHVPRELRPAP